MTDTEEVGCVEETPEEEEEPPEAGPEEEDEEEEAEELLTWETEESWMKGEKRNYYIHIKTSTTVYNIIN